MKRYGIHTMSDLEDFPDAESQEYGRRWRLFKVDGMMHKDPPVVEQHYGIPTCGLDVTFDLSVAAFFATHRFKWRDDGTAYYERVQKGHHSGVIYGFVFTDPPLRRTEEMVTDLPLFEHIRPVRPITQKCALPFFHSHNINEAVCELDFVFHLSHDFDCSALPNAESLFPGEEDDPFYEAVLSIKRKSAGA